MKRTIDSSICRGHEGGLARRITCLRKLVLGFFNRWVQAPHSRYATIWLDPESDFWAKLLGLPSSVKSRCARNRAFKCWSLGAVRRPTLLRFVFIITRCYPNTITPQNLLWLCDSFFVAPRTAQLPRSHTYTLFVFRTLLKFPNRTFPPASGTDHCRSSSRSFLAILLQCESSLQNRTIMIRVFKDARPSSHGMQAVISDHRGRFSDCVQRWTQIPSDNSSSLGEVVLSEGWCVKDSPKLHFYGAFNSRDGRNPWNAFLFTFMARKSFANPFRARLLLLHSGASLKPLLSPITIC